MNIHGAHSYWKQEELGAAGVRHVWAGAACGVHGQGHVVRPCAQLVC